jgi:type IV secretory pathway VirB2 component (pilin)
MMRSADTPAIRELVRRLLVYEGAETSPSMENIHAVSRVCDKLRGPLATLAGIAGFRSLLARALTMAKQDSPDLGGWEVKLDGSLEGLNGEAAQSGAVLIAHLIGLMITFIGESLTLRLLIDVWPDVLGSEIKFEGDESQ